MNIRDFERIARTDRSAMRYIASHLVKSTGIHCPSCGNRKIYSIESGRRRRCARCEYTFHLLTGKWLNRLKIGITDWLWIIKLFELETPASVIAAETGVSYPTVLKAVDTIRMSLACSLEQPLERADGEPSLFVTPPVFGLGPANGGNPGPVLLDSSDILLYTTIDEGYLILAKKSLGHASLHVHGRTIGIVDYGRSFPRCRVYCDRNGFWPFAKERLAKHHGVSYGKLGLYLKESEFRWKHGDSDLFEEIVGRLCGHPPRKPEECAICGVAI